MKQYEKLGIPGQIKIGDYTYIYKSQLKSNVDTFTYRCQKWDCRIPINITRENIKKIE